MFSEKKAADDEETEDDEEEEEDNQLAGNYIKLEGTERGQNYFMSKFTPDHPQSQSYALQHLYLR